MPDRLSPAQRQALASRDAPFLATGLIVGNPASFEAHVRQAARLMAERQTSASPSARLVSHLADLFERSVPDAARTSTMDGKINGSPGKIRTCDQPVNSRLLYH